MNGSLLGRGRGGRLAVYAGCVAVVILLVFAYRAAVSEMTRLRDLYDQCSSHQESLQQRLQVIFDYKVRLEKSLADETSANAAVKQELQQRANREKTRRDKDSVEAMQRYNSLQQDYKTLQTEHQDYQEECEKKQQILNANITRLENLVQELRLDIKQAKEDKIQSLEHLKNKYLEVDIEKSKLDEKYNEVVKNNEHLIIENQRLEKEAFQLNREIEEVKRSCSSHRAASPSLSSDKLQQLQSNNMANVEADEVRRREAGDGEAEDRGQGPRPAASQDSLNMARPPSADLQQGTSTTMSGMVQHATRNSELPSKSVTKLSTQSAPLDKVNLIDRFKVQKLPAGVLPIPRMFDSYKNSGVLNVFNDENNNNNNNNNINTNNNINENNVKVVRDKKDDKNLDHVVNNSNNNNNKDNNNKNNIPDPPKIVPQMIGRHGGGGGGVPAAAAGGDQQPIGRNDNWSWQHQVPPGVQEVGEDPNNLPKIPELEDTGNHPVADGVEYDGQYEGGDYGKEIAMRNNDLHIEEGEDEGEDEDDAMDYDGNNLKVEKHPE